MLQKLTGHIARRLALGTSFIVAGISVGQAETAAPPLTDELMNKAIGYIGAVLGRDVDAEDSRWLKQQWSEDYSKTPAGAIAGLDGMALKLELIERDADPVGMATYRNELIDDTYCAAQMTSDPSARRAKDVLAPDDVVLVADCVYGFVVTTFDVEGLAASHALTAEIVGQSHDTAADLQNLMSAIPAEFEGWDPTNKGLAAGGELRHAIAAKFWALLDGDPKKTETANILRGRTGQEPSAIMASARNLETLALGEIGKLDYIAKVGEVRLTSGMVGTYLQWLERIAGYPFSPRDRVWLRGVIVEEFEADPAKMQQEIAAVDDYNRAYRGARGDGPGLDTNDPGRLAKQKAMLDGWTAQLHCYLSQSSDPDEMRLAEVVFAENPVISSDCTGSQVTRKSDAVLAEAGGQRLTEAMLVPAMRVAMLLFGRPLTADEAAVARKDWIKAFEQDPAKALAEMVEYQKLLHEYDGGGSSYAKRGYERESNRRDLFVTVYCGLQQSEEPDDRELLAMLKEANVVVHEDCSQQLVTTERTVDAFIASSNFLAFVSGKPPFTQAEEAEFVKALRRENVSWAEISLASYLEWWPALSVEKKAKAVDQIRSFGIDHPSEAGQHIRDVSSLAQLELVLAQVNAVACQVAAITAEHDAAMFVLESGPYAYRADSTDAGIGFSGAKFGQILSNSILGNALCG